MEWGPWVNKKGAAAKAILKKHPRPHITEEIVPIIDALNKLSGDRINTYSQVPYSSLVIYMERKIMSTEQTYFEELFTWADQVLVSKKYQIDSKNNETGK